MMDTMGADSGSGEPFFLATDFGEAIKDPLCDMDLWTAASVGDMDQLWELNYGPVRHDLNGSNLNGWTPCMYAAYYDHTEIVKFLFEHQVQVVGVRNNKGRTPLMMAAMCGNENVARLLIKQFGKAVLEETDALGRTALFHAAICGHADLTQILLEAGSDPNAIEESRGLSPLMMACQEGHELIVQHLIHFGAHISYNNILGENARTISANRGHERIVKFLKKIQKATQPQPSVLDGPAQLAEKMKRNKDFQCSGGGGLNKSLKSFLIEVGVDKYVPFFEEKSVTLEQLLSMTDEDLKELGIDLMGPRRKLTSAIARHKNKAKSGN